MEFSTSLKENFEFRRLYSKGRSLAGPHIVLYAKVRERDTNQVGLTVSAKLAHAVRRNRVKRRLREAYRLNEGKFRRGLDLVIVVRGRGVDAPYRTLEAELLELAGRMELLR